MLRFLCRSRCGGRRGFFGKSRLGVLQALLRIVIVWIDPEGLLIIRDALLVILQIGDVGVTPFRVNVGIGFDLQTLVVIGDRFVVFLLAAIDKPAAFVSLRIVWILFQDRGKVCSRFSPVAHPDLG